MPSQGNGKPPSDLAKKLVRRDYTEQIGGIGEERIINRNFLRQHLGAFDPEYIDLYRLYQMRRDPMIQMGLHYSKAPLIRSKWHIDCERKDIAAGVDEIIRKVYGPYMRVLLNMMDFGFQAGIKQFELGYIDATFEDPDSGDVKKVWEGTDVQPMVLKAPMPLPPDYASVKLDKGKFAGIHTTIASASRVSGTDDPRLVPPEFAIWMVNEFEESFRNYYGYPRTGYAYRYWWSYWFRFHMEDRHFEMDADPALQIWYPPGFSKDADNNDKSNRTTALEIGNDLRGGATIAMPSDVHIDEQGKATTTPLWKAEFLKGGENLSAFRESSEYLDIMKLRAILVPEQALVEGKGGTSSRNVAASYGDIFNESLGQMADDIDDYWNRYIIPQIVEANWGADAPRAKKVTSGFEDEDLTLSQELIKLAFQTDPNALPVNFEELTKKVNLPVYSPKEQQEREQAAAEQQAEAQQKALEQRRVQLREEQRAGGVVPGGGGRPPAAPPPGGSAGLVKPPVALSIDGEEPRMVLYQHQHGQPVEAVPPDWAKREGEIRKQSIMALSERLEAVAHDRYDAAFDLIAAYMEQEGDQLSLGVIDDVGAKILNKLRDVLKSGLGHYRPRMKAEMASMFHAAGASILNRLGLDLSNWDVARDEVQGWADERAQFTEDSMDETILSQAKPALWSWLAEIHPEAGIPTEAHFRSERVAHLTQELRDMHKERPLWMAARLARTEARRSYNMAGAQIWEWAGVEKVKAYDGLGGFSGKTDPECLARNGQVMTLSEFRKADEDEHPNGTLGAVPIVEGDLRDIPPGTLRADAVRSTSMYAVDGTGLILSQDATAELIGSGAVAR